MNKPGKKDSRIAKTPPEKKRIKTLEQPSSPVQEEPEPVSCVLQGDEIQALAIKLEDLEKLHTSRLQPEEKEKPRVTKNFLIRKSRPQEDGKKSHFLVAYPALTDESKKTLNYSGVEGPLVDNSGYILPHSILGTLQEFKREALKREDFETARLVRDDSQLRSTIQVLGKYKEKHEEKKETHMLPSQHMALQNWHYNMALRKEQQRRLCDRLQRSESELLMNNSDDYRKTQEQRALIDLSLSALYAGKGHQGTEFWQEPVHIGDEITGLTLTLSQTERGYPDEVTHIGKPNIIWKEMGTRPPKCLPFRRAWEKSLFVKQRRNELKEILEELDFYNPDLDGLEVVSKSQPFTNVSAERLTPYDVEEKEFPEEEKVQDPFEEYPDVFSEPILGPSLKFCGQPARWIDDACHEGEIGIAARVTFEILVGEKAESVLTVSNDGTAAIWYDWRRLPQPFTFQERKMKRVQNFYFNTRSGVILPGEARNFSFIFKSVSAGIFSESWEFGTHPVLLGGAVLQVTLWGVALYEDISSDIREDLQKELDAREGAVIVEENLKELLARIRTPELPRSPLDAYATEEDLFHRQNPELHYQHQVVKELHELWDRLMNPPPSTYEGSSPAKSIADLQQKSPEGAVRTRSVSPAVSGVEKSTTDELVYLPSRTTVGDVSQMEVVSRVEWNLSIADFKRTVLTFPEEEEREAALSQLNKAALELCTVPVKPQPDLLYQICFQLWREVIDGLVARSLMLRSLLGMPEKDIYVETVPEEPVEVKPVAVGKVGKEDRKLQREEKKAAAKEKEKAKVAKEERPNSRKTKVREEKKPKSSVKESKEVMSYPGEVAEIGLQEQREQVDPVLQEKYHEKLYIEVYTLLNSMVSKMTFLFDELKDSVEKKTKVHYV